MRCPRDCAALVRTDRSGVEVDYCPECRGVWLDRGELDQIIRRSGERGFDDYESPVRPHRQSSHHEDYEYDDDHGHGQSSQSGRKKRESFLGDLFDF